MIYRVAKDRNYSVISNNYLKDKNLSFGSIGLMTLLLSFKDDTEFSLKLISNVSGKSEKIVSKYINELKKNFYVSIDKCNSRYGFYYKYNVYEDKRLNPKYSPDDQTPSWENPRWMEDTLYISTIIKQDKKDKTNLTNLTKYILNVGLINKDDINLYRYNDFFNAIINKYEYEYITKAVTYTTTHIIKNNFKDENNKSIKNLLVYFKSSVISNIEKLSEDIDSLWD